MQIFHSLDNLTLPWSSSILTLGVFDGMHRGHEALMEKLIREDHNQARILVTYNPHPDIVLRKSRDDQRRELYTYQEKLSLLQKYDLDAVIFLPFTKELAEMTAYEYLKGILIERLRASKIIIGYDQCFGKNRQGDFSFLTEKSAEFGYAVEKVDAVTWNGEIISSSAIRSALKGGNLEKAKSMLGRDFCISGLVVRGRQRGREIGFPTANIDVPESKVLPLEGVYAGTAEYANQQFRVMLNIGKNPTFSESFLSVEAHLLDFQKNIYGENLRIFIKKRIRSEMKFSGPDALKQQLQKDRMETLQYADLQSE